MKNQSLHNQSDFIWLIDPGHGQDTPGKRSPKWEDGTQLFEWEYTRSIAYKFIEKLRSHSLNYVLLVPEEKDISLSERIKRAENIKHQNQKKQCIYLSIHGNAYGVVSASGFEVFTSPGQTRSDKVASIMFEYARKLGLKMRKDTTDGDNDKEARFKVLVGTSMPAVLVELGFFTNYIECQKMMSEDFQNSCAKVLLCTALEVEIKSIE